MLMEVRVGSNERTCGPRLTLHYFRLQNPGGNFPGVAMRAGRRGRIGNRLCPAADASGNWLLSVKVTLGNSLRRGVNGVGCLQLIPITKREPVSIVRTGPLDLRANRSRGRRAHRTVSTRGHCCAWSNFEVQDVA